MAGRKTARAARTGKRSLDEFTKEKQRETCPVCKLAPELQEQIAAASTKRVPVAVICEWLQSEYGLTVSEAEFIRHGRGAHGWRGRDGKVSGARRR